MRKLARWIAGALVIADVVAAYLAYFVTSFDRSSGIWRDWFGRPLSETPWFIRFIFRHDDLWPGWWWFAADIVTFWSLIGLAYLLTKFAMSKDTKGPA